MMDKYELEYMHNSEQKLLKKIEADKKSLERSKFMFKCFIILIFLIIISLTIFRICLKCPNLNQLNRLII